MVHAVKTEKLFTNKSQAHTALDYIGLLYNSKSLTAMITFPHDFNDVFNAMFLMHEYWFIYFFYISKPYDSLLTKNAIEFSAVDTNRLACDDKSRALAIVPLENSKKVLEFAPVPSLKTSGVTVLKRPI